MGDHDRGVDVAALVLTEIRRALGERGGDLTVLSGAERFDDLGVTSLDLAELVATLDAKLGSSPFRTIARPHRAADGQRSPTCLRSAGEG